jgi:PAS domain S-box-containing protein
VTVTSAASASVLVLGANPQRRADLADMLSELGFPAVLDAGSPEEGRGAAPVGVLVDLDVDEGVAAGQATCQSLRSDPATAALPLLVVLDASLAGPAGAALRAQLILAGADACLVRPVDPSELTAVLGALLRIRSEVRDLRRRAEDLQLSLAERSEALEQWHALFSSSSAGIVTIDGEGLVQAWNASAERMFGWQANEVIGKPPPFVPSSGEKEYRQALSTLAEGREVSPIETIRMHRNGTPVRVALSRAPIRDDQGRSRGSIATLVDVTTASADRDRAAELGALLSTLVDRAPIGLAFVDTGLRFQRVNQDMADLDGVSTEDHAGRHVGEVLKQSGPTLVPLLEDVLHSRTPCLDIELAGDSFRDAGPGGEMPAWLASLYPVETSDGTLLGAGLIVHDVTERRRIDAERARLFEAEHAARQRAQQLQTALAAVAAASSRSEVGEALVDLGLPALGALAGAVAVIDPAEPDRLLLLASSGYEDTILAPGQRHALDVLSPIGDAIRRGLPVYLDSRDELLKRYPGASEDLLGPGHAWAALPLRSGGEVLGALGLAFSEPRAFQDEDRLVVGGFISQAADALARAGRQEAEHDVAVTLQQSLLTTDLLPTDSTSVTVRYLPAVSALEVGGDFYDAVHLDDHRVMLIVGDVVGHGLQAAVAMGQLRSAAQALASSHNPAGLLTALDRFVANNEQARFATVACVLLDPIRGEIRFSLAGHPPPMVRRQDGTIIQLAEPRGAPLGTTGRARREGRVAMAGPSLVVLYTDGLIERRNESISVGLDRLAEALAVIEAATNAIEHAGLGADGVVTVEAEHVPPGMLTFLVSDPGRWREGSSDPYRGRGIAIMHRLMDHVAITRAAEGTSVILRKHLDGDEQLEV